MFPGQSFAGTKGKRTCKFFRTHCKVCVSRIHRSQLFNNQRTPSAVSSVVGSLFYCFLLTHILFPPEMGFRRVIVRECDSVAAVYHWLFYLVDIFWTQPLIDTTQLSDPFFNNKRNSHIFLGWFNLPTISACPTGKMHSTIEKKALLSRAPPSKTVCSDPWLVGFFWKCVIWILGQTSSKPRLGCIAGIWSKTFIVSTIVPNRMASYHEYYF